VRRRKESVYKPQLPVEDTDITDMIALYVDEQNNLPARPMTMVLRNHNEITS
jgi:hypothetical protein